MPSSLPLGNKLGSDTKNQPRAEILSSPVNIGQHQGSNRRGVTWGWVTDRFPKIQSGSLIEIAKNGVFCVFRVILPKNILEAPKMSKIGQLCTKSGSLSSFKKFFKIFCAFGAEKWVTYRFWSPPLPPLGRSTPPLFDPWSTSMNVSFRSMSSELSNQDLGRYWDLVRGSQEGELVETTVVVLLLLFQIIETF